MNTQQFDETISALALQVEDLRKSMQQSQEDFLHSTTIFISEWIQSSVEKAVTTKPEVSKKLGVEGLRKLKSELNKVVTDIPNLVSKELNSDQLWAHRLDFMLDPNKKYGRYQSYGGGPEVLNESIRALMGYGGALLVKHGYAGTGYNSEWDTDYNGTSQHLKYKHRIEWSSDMKLKLENYAILYDKYFKLAQELETVKGNKASFEAKNLWDQA